MENIRFDLSPGWLVTPISGNEQQPLRCEKQKREVKSIGKTQCVKLV